MAWYEIGFRYEAVERGDHRKLIQGVQSIWETHEKPVDFALFGAHILETPYGTFTVYYLSPAAQKYCSDGFFTFWQVFPTDRTPPHENLSVIVGDAAALGLLD